MEIKHNFGKQLSIVKNDGPGDASLMLAEGGSYLWIGGIPASRYQGWFFKSGQGLVKIIDDIRINDAAPVSAIENNVWNVKRSGKDFSQTFFLPRRDCLVCETGKPARMEFYFDVKEPYQNPEFGRIYKVWRENEIIIISYRQDVPMCMPEIFIAITGDISDVLVAEEWIERDYEFDRKRGSRPWKRWVCRPLAVTASCVVLAVAANKDEAERTARSCWRGLGKVKEEKNKKSVLRGALFFGNCSDDVLAKKCALRALSMLVAPAGPVRGLRAGLPWFFQFWQRDEAVCLPELLKADVSLAKEIFWRQLGELKAKDFDFDTADGIGWLFFAAAGFIGKGDFDIKEAAIVQNCLERALAVLLEKYTVNGLAIGGQKPTWMDSLDRSGASIEVQAQRLAMYSLAARFAPGKNEKERWLESERELAVSARLAFFDGHRLADRVDVSTGTPDFTARPNIFLAAYLYPDLLEKAEWARCFEYALPQLWCGWGGLDTIDKSDPRFCGKDTGEEPTAYHNGDSWFWVNNIAAVALNRLDKKKFSGYIGKIYEASKKDILWNGAIGCASEISPAESYAPTGCANQAWSNATFLELCRELKK